MTKGWSSENTRHKWFLLGFGLLFTTAFVLAIEWLAVISLLGLCACGVRMYWQHRPGDRQHFRLKPLLFAFAVAVVLIAAIILALRFIPYHP